MALDRLTQITSSGISSTAPLTGINITGVVTATSITASNYGVVNATSVNISSQGLQVNSGVSTFINGPVLIGAATSTGTTTQRLQVTGSAYVSGNLGIGTTNPQTKLEISGVLGFGAGYNVKIGDNTTGSSLTSGTNNTLIGYAAGTSGSYNNILGYGAGYAGGNGSHNNFFGYIAGYGNGTGSNNNFFGNSAGYGNNSGSSNNFFGSNAGQSNNSGSSNNFIGVSAGYNNNSGSNNIFLGARNGISASASYKVIIGSGYLTNYFDSPDTNKDTQFAIGVRTDANASKYWLVGNENFNVGIGTTNPVGQLQVSSGPVIIGAAISTGTASQTLQVTGGAYVSGLIGIGISNPLSKLHVDGPSPCAVFAPTISTANSDKVGAAKSFYVYIDREPTSAVWGDSSNRDRFFYNSLYVRTPVKDTVNNPAIVIAENGGQATGRNSLVFWNGDYGSGDGYLKSRIYTEVGNAYNNTAFYIDVADSNRAIQNRLKIDVGGRLTIPYQPCFHAYGVSGGTYVSPNYWIFPSTYVNIGNCYNTTNGVFTAPVAGTYIFWWSFIGNSTNDVYRYVIHKNNSAVNSSGLQLRIDTSATGTEYGANGAQKALVTLSTNDTIRIYFSSDGGNSSYPGGNSTIDGYPNFGGYLFG